MASREALRRAVDAERSFASRERDPARAAALAAASWTPTPTAPTAAAKAKAEARRDAGEHYDGACGACARRRRWCGFAHHAKRFAKRSPQARREQTVDEDFARAQKRVLVSRLEPTDKAAFFKLCSRLEKHFARQPLGAENDPRRLLPREADAAISRDEVARVWTASGVKLENAEMALLLQGMRRRKKASRVRREEVLRAFCAVKAFRVEVNRFVVADTVQS